MDGISSGQLSVGSFIPTFMKRLYTEELNAYLQLSFLLACDPEGIGVSS